MSDPICFLNGEYLPLHEARIPVLDRGFIFGDGVYEVVPVYGGRLFRIDEHMARLQRSLAKLRIPEPASAQDREHGVLCVTAQDFRWARGDIKSVSLLGNVLARQISADVGATETIMFRDGWLTEASASNVWVVRDGALLGVPKSEVVLEGIRFELLRELCEECGIPYALRPISEAEVRTADELMLSSATKEVLPITRLDGQPVGHGAQQGRPGPVYARLYEAYQRAKVRMGR